MEYPKFKVCCRCFTFNQAKYITDAMNGFTMQQTSFPFVCIIVDDASTDGEQQVIKQYVEDNFDFSDDSAAFNKETEYAHITYAQHKTNKNCYFAVLYLKENHYSQRKSKMGYLSEWRDMCEYAALCEGDDYWINPLKLQKQVDFLEENPEYGIVRTNVHRYIQKDGKLEENFFSYGEWTKIKDTYHDYIINGWFAAPCTWMYRAKYIAKHASFNEKDCFTGDIALLLCITQDCKIKYLPESMAVYRVLEKSASHFDDFNQTWSFFIKNKNTRLHFAKKEYFAFRFRCWFLISYNYFMILLRHKRPELIPNWLINTLKDFLIVF